MSQSESQPKAQEAVTTELLQDMLAHGQHNEAIETTLRDELRDRGVPARKLDAITSQRRRRKRVVESGPDPLITVGAYGRVGAILLAAPVFLLLMHYIGERAAFAGAAVVIALYLVWLLLRVRAELRLPHDSMTRFWLTWQCAEASIVLLIMLVPVVFSGV